MLNLLGTCKGSLCDHYNLTRCVPPRARSDELCKTFCLSPITGRCEFLCKLVPEESCNRFLAPGTNHKHRPTTSIREHIHSTTATALTEARPKLYSLITFSGLECANGEGTCDFRGYCFRASRKHHLEKYLTIACMVLLMILYSCAIVFIAERIPHGNFARSLEAKKLKAEVLNYVKSLQELAIRRDV